MKLILRIIALKMSILRVDAAIIKRKKVKLNAWPQADVIILSPPISNDIKYTIALIKISPKPTILFLFIRNILAPYI